MHSSEKYYPVYTGMMNIILYGYEQNEAMMLECVVFLELVRRDYTVSVESYRSGEIDFTAWVEGRPLEFYQGALKLDGRKTLDKELDSFMKMGNGYR